MANETSGGLAAAVKALESVRDLLKKVSVALTAESSPAAADSPKTEEKDKLGDEAESMAARARKKYDSALKWVLGLFSVVGLLIFGSIPFANLTDVEFWPIAGLGLIAAGVGLMCVVFGTTQGLELQDASLGELARTLKDFNTSSHQPSVIFARKRAAYELYKILSGPEAAAHLGPGMNSVPDLIQRIGDLEQRVMAEQIGWGGAVGMPNAAQLDSSARARAFVAELAAKEAPVAKTRIEEIRASLEAATPSEQGSLTQALQTEVARYVALLGQAAPAIEVTRRGRLDALRKALRRYLNHREMVLEESLVSQIRGTYRVVWRWLIAGGLLTLAGGVAYAYAVSNPEKEPAGLRTAISVNLVKDSPGWKAAKKCVGAGQTTDIQGLPGLLVTSEDSDGRQDGPFTFVVTKSGCEGTKIDVAQSDGSYQPQTPRPATQPNTPDQSASSELVPISPARVVRVRLKVNTPAWRNAVDCHRGNRTKDVRGLRALLTARLPGDEGRDGPFTIRTADPKCGRLALDITVANHDGRYRPARASR